MIGTLGTVRFVSDERERARDTTSAISSLTEDRPTGVEDPLSVVTGARSTSLKRPGEPVALYASRRKSLDSEPSEGGLPPATPAIHRVVRASGRAEHDVLTNTACRRGAVAPSWIADFPDHGNVIGTDQPALPSGLGTATLRNPTFVETSDTIV